MTSRRAGWLLLLLVTAVRPGAARALAIDVTGILATGLPDSTTTTTLEETTTTSTEPPTTTTTTEPPTTTTVTTTTEPPTTTTTEPPTTTSSTTTTTVPTTTTTASTTTATVPTTTSTTSTTVTLPTTTRPSTSTTTTSVPSTTRSTTTTTLPVAPLCVDGALIERATLRIRTVSRRAPGGVLIFTGRIPLLAIEGTIDPRTTGVQIEIGEVGRAGGVPTLAGYTAARGLPVPAGTRGIVGCARGDGWKGGVYRNRSGRLDPPACDTDAEGLQTVRVKDRRARGNGVVVQVMVQRVPVPDLSLPISTTIVLGGPDAGHAGLCGHRVFDPSACSRRADGVRCR